MSLAQSPLLSVYKKQTPTRRPIWFMRQAGRYLPEYREIRAKNSMLKTIQTPKLAAEVTLQPLRRFDFDGAIIFADILNPLIGMGINLDFVEKEGPKIFNPIQFPADVSALKIPDPTQSVPYTLEAISLVASELNPKGIPVLGFCGAPFTLASYMIEGGGSHSLTKLKRFMFSEKDAWNDLQGKLVEYLVRYLLAQVQAGASAVQVFDTWVGYVSPDQFAKYVQPSLDLLVKEFKQYSDVPIIYFSTSSRGLFPQISKLPFDVFSIDWRMKLTDAASLSVDKPLQGNLDPEALAAPKEILKEEIQSVLNDAKGIPHHVFNLGHGILPHLTPESVSFAIDCVRSMDSR